MHHETIVILGYIYIIGVILSMGLIMYMTFKNSISKLKELEFGDWFLAIAISILSWLGIVIICLIIICDD